MGTWELWSDASDPAQATTFSFFRADGDPQRTRAQEEGLVRVWTVEARGLNPAMSAYHQHMGYEPYQPMLRDDGTPYPEHEDDDWETPS